MRKLTPNDYELFEIAKSWLNSVEPNKAGWGHDQHGTIAAFKEGLFEPLLVQCIKQQPKPVTLTE